MNNYEFINKEFLKRSQKRVDLFDDFIEPIK